MAIAGTAAGALHRARFGSAARLAAGPATAALVAVAVAAGHPDRSPLSPDNAGGETRWSWLFLGALGGAFVLYVASLAGLRRRGLPLAFAIGVAVLIQVAPLAGPVLLSTDVYTYWARGRVAAVHGENPYRVAPSAFPDDPAYELMGASWRDRPTGYGPGFTLLSEGHAAAVGESGAVASGAYRGIAALSMIALVLLAAALARRRAFAAVFVGWNPVLAVHAAGGGHNDALMIALVLGALFLAARARPELAGVAWAGSIAVKWVPIVFLPLRYLEARASGRRVRHAGLALSVAVIAAVASWRYGSGWLESFGNFGDQLGRTTSLSVPSLLGRAGLPEGAAIALLAGLFGCAYLWLLREAWKGRARLGLCAALLVLTTSWLVPWYAMWVVPLAAIEEERGSQLLALGLSAYLLRGAVPL